MQKRKVTVHFGQVRVVVPCPDDGMTVSDLVDAAIQRYKKASGLIDSDVRVHRLECLRDGGILDPDDFLADVFDESKDQILAIYDEQSPNGSGLGSNQLNSPIPSYSSFSTNSTGLPLMTSSPVLPRSRPARPTSHYNPSSPFYSGLGQSISMDFPQNNNHPSRIYANPPPAYGTAVGKIRDSVVEVKNANSLPSNGLMVYSPSEGAISNNSPPVRSSLRSGSSTPSRNRVTLSPEVEKKLNNHERTTSGRFARNSARKSRISESFYDAQEKLEDVRQAAEDALPSTAATPGRAKLEFLEEAPNETIIAFPDDERTPMGVEVSGLFENPSENSSRRPESTLRLMSVQITRIEPDGRVARDGRLKVGDKILAIDGRPVSQMSIHRARAYLADLQEKSFPSLTVDRPISSFQDEPSLGERNLSANSSQRRLILSALQKANTKNIGQTITERLTKNASGFGFTVTGRETAAGERLFYIGTVKPNGVALGHLRAGDRLLQINDEKTADLSQPQVVELLKNAQIGETVAFLVSRVEDEDKENKEDDSPKVQEIQVPTIEEHEFEILLNSTGTAGLGIRLKARVTIRSDKTREDCGIFVKSVLTGGAADKDNRLRVNDRIIGIEDIRLDGDSNAEANTKISSCFKSLGHSKHSVRLRIQRKSISTDQPISLEQDCPSHGATATPSPISLGFSQSSEDKRSSTASDIRGDEMEQASPDAFDREAPARKSISEKRGMGTTNDPNHIRLFQDIKHQRQTSAPPVSSSPMVQSAQSARSASQRNAARARSQSVHPRSPTQPDSLQPPTSVGARRSLSMESVEHTPLNGRKDVSPHPFPPGTAINVDRRDTNINRDKQRRKSMGSAVKSWFGLSKETSPDRSERIRQAEAAKQEDMDRRRVQDYYDRLRQQEAITNRNFSAASLPQRHAYREPPYPPQQPIASSYDYDLYDRYQAHRYPEEFNRSPASRPQPPPYHNPLPSGKSVAYAQPGPYANYPDPQSLPRRPVPDYYHMFNSWFAYSGGGAAGAAPAIKAAFGNTPERSSSRANERGEWSRLPQFYQQGAEPSQLYSDRFSHY